MTPPMRLNRAAQPALNRTRSPEPRRRASVYIERSDNII